ncbi:MAG: glycoside hydrolase family 3 protein [Phycisphaeraceae bacterium]|nr:MAG: glycoside hydrolase family 3 protein [Phycisphaeraceae bacterium]
MKGRGHAGEIGRLLCVGVRGAGPDDAVLRADLEACAEAGVGGVILFDVDVPAWRGRVERGEDPEAAALACPRNVVSPVQLRRLTGFIRERLGEDVLICVDQEGGRSSRLNERRGFQAGVSAAEFAELESGQKRTEAARQAGQLADAGIDVNLVPCVDLAIDPASSVIAGKGRAFGGDIGVVIENAGIVLEALAARGVGGCLKHFPGHGSVAGDSHEGVVDITGTHQDRELEPYRVLLAERGAASMPQPAVMVAHVMHRGRDEELPASLSGRVIGGVLRERIGFDGVVVTDSIDMRAISDRWSAGRAAVLAVKAGVDLVIDGFNLLAGRAEHPAREMAAALREAVERGEITAGRVGESLERLDRWRGSLRQARSAQTEGKA